VLAGNRDATVRPHRGKLRLEAQDVVDCDTIETASDLPRREESGVDELVNGLTTELPAAAQLGYAQPNRTDAAAKVLDVGRRH
jgi:hypothetical protein